MPYFTDCRNSCPNTGCSRQLSRKPSVLPKFIREATGLGMTVLAATCQICSFLSTVSPLCSSVFASKCFPGTVLLANCGPSEKVLFFIRNFKSWMYFMNVELCAAGCCLAGGITFLLNPQRFQASKFSHLFSFNKFSPLCTQGQLWWHHSSTYTFSLRVALLEAIYSIIL